MIHPLQISVVTAGPEFGRIGVTSCPGKYDRHSVKGKQDGDLAADLDTIRNWGATAVVTLLKPKEMTLLGVDRLGEEVTQRGMRWFHLPIADFSIPDERFEQQWKAHREGLCSILRSKRDVLVHCRGGLGRSGMIAARLLIELGTEPHNAIVSIRAARPGAIETNEQERFVLGLRIDTD